MVKDSTYADDIALVTETPDDNQLCIDAFSKATDWTVTMKAKPRKCFSLAFRLFKGEKSRYTKVLHTQYSSFDPLLVIKGYQMHFIASLPKGPTCSNILAASSSVILDQIMLLNS